MSSPRVLIVGGGIGGLALAQGLRKHGIAFTVFEQDLTATARAQGYRVRLSDNKGASSLRECLDQELWDLFHNTSPQLTQHGGRFNAVDGTERPGFSPPSRGPLSNSHANLMSPKAYNADRSLLRSLLLLGQGNNVQFGKSFQRYEVTPTGVKAFFRDGSIEEGTLLVGADGVASRVRRQLLPKIRYIDTGSRFIYGKTPITPDLETRFLPKYMKGITVIQDESPLTLFLEPIRLLKDASIVSRGRLSHTEDYVYWVLGGSHEHFPASDDEFLALSHRAAANMTLKMTKHWDPSFQALFEFQNTEQASPLRIISSKPERPDWTPCAQVTLLGDAIHASIPVGGIGANTALEDAASLVKIIVEEGISEKSMGKYIDHMWEEAVSNIERGLAGGKMLLGLKGYDTVKEVEFEA